MNQEHSTDYIGLAENISLSASIACLLIVHGNRQHDRFAVKLPDNSNGTTIWKLEQLVHQSLKADVTFLYDAVDGAVKLAHGEGCIKDLPENDQTKPQKKDLCKLLNYLLETVDSDEASKTNARIVLVIEASLLFADSNSPQGKEFELLKCLEKIGRRAPPAKLTIVLKTDNTQSIPGALSRSSFTASVAIPATSRDERHAYIRLRGGKLAEKINTDIDSLANSIAGVTDQWILHSVDRLVETACLLPGIDISDIEALAQSMMTGVSKSPWLGENIRKVVRDCRTQLTSRVKGQPAAIEAVITVLKKSVLGLSAATQSSLSTAPKGVFFFAGPTGTGKTELAKTLAQLIYGSESNIIRFDCGELQQEHSVNRLIGAPPGYVGYEAGGELTDAVSANPSSVVLFDEIEKAHPRLLDTLLSVLDDGRLTNGQGQVTYFTDALIVFTSNLGMHGENEHGQRTLRFSQKTKFSKIQSGIRDKIAEEFEVNLARPELLGRLGGKDNIIVFDYLRQPQVREIISKYIDNIAQKLKRTHNIELAIDENVIEQVADRMDDNEDLLSLGGRGIAQVVTRDLIEPLTLWLFDKLDDKESIKTVQVILSEDKSLAFAMKESAPATPTTSQSAME